VLTYWAVNWKVGTTEFCFFLLVRTSPRPKTTGESLYGIAVFGEWMVSRYSKYLS